MADVKITVLKTLSTREFFGEENAGELVIPSSTDSLR